MKNTSQFIYQGEVKLWDTPSTQCVRSLPHKGTVVTVQFMPTPPSLIDRWILSSLTIKPWVLLRDRWQPSRKLVALQKGAQQGGEFSCTILRREDLQGRDWDEEVVAGGGQADSKEVRHFQCLPVSIKDEQPISKDGFNTSHYLSAIKVFIIC